MSQNLIEFTLELLLCIALELLPLLRKLMRCTSWAKQHEWNNFSLSSNNVVKKSEAKLYHE